MTMPAIAPNANNNCDVQRLGDLAHEQETMTGEQQEQLTGNKSNSMPPKKKSIKHLRRLVKRASTTGSIKEGGNNESIGMENTADLLSIARNEPSRESLGSYRNKDSNSPSFSPTRKSFRKLLKRGKCNAGIDDQVLLSGEDLRKKNTEEVIYEFPAVDESDVKEEETGTLDLLSEQLTPASSPVRKSSCKKKHVRSPSGKLKSMLKKSSTDHTHKSVGGDVCNSPRSITGKTKSWDSASVTTNAQESPFDSSQTSQQQPDPWSTVPVDMISPSCSTEPIKKSNEEAKHQIPPPPPIMSPITNSGRNITASTILGPAPIMLSSEEDPSLYQLEIPAPNSLLMNAKICSVLGDNSDMDFDVLLESQQQQLTPQPQQEFMSLSCAGTPPLLSSSPSTIDKKQCVQKQHPVSIELGECGADDLVMEGFFRVGKAQNETQVDAAVMFTQKQRQFIVCFKGPEDLQAKPPVKQKHSKSKKQNGGVEVGIAHLHSGDPVSVHPLFQDAYFSPNLESMVFSLLTMLSDRNPFCDVVFTGNSFGAAVATIGAMRYAAQFPMMRVSCFVFGCPKIGGISFRRLVHSLPNLKVVRVESESDPYVCLPEGKEWLHCGHTLSIQLNSNSSGAATVESTTSKPAATTTEKENDTTAITSPPPVQYEVIAYKFDANRRKGGKKLSTKKTHKKQDHLIGHYVTLLTYFSTSEPWVNGFAGEKGHGVNGSGNDSRHVV